MSAAEQKGAAARRLIALFAGLAVVVLIYAGWQQLGDGDGDRGPPARAPAPDTGPPAPPGPADAPPRPTVPEPAADDTGRAREAQPHEVLADMRQVWACYEAADCSLGRESDPRAEYFEADRRLAAGMRTLIEQHRNHRISDLELAQAAHEVLQYDSGRARAAAIEALAKVPPADEHLDALLAVLDQHHDEKLFELALPQLQRYAEAGRREAVDAFLQANLRSGAHFPARTIARELGPFLTPDNVDSYRALAQELPQDSRRAQLLKETLRAYEGKS